MITLPLKMYQRNPFYKRLAYFFPTLIEKRKIKVYSPELNSFVTFKVLKKIDQNSYRSEPEFRKLFLVTNSLRKPRVGRYG